MDQVLTMGKKYNIPQRTTIGKMADSDESMMYPNPNYEKYFPENPLPETRSSDFRSSCIKAGSFIVIKKIMEDMELLNAIHKSTRSKAEILAFLESRA